MIKVPFRNSTTPEVIRRRNHLEHMLNNVFPSWGMQASPEEMDYMFLKRYNKETDSAIDEKREKFYDLPPYANLNRFNMKKHVPYDPYALASKTIWEEANKYNKRIKELEIEEKPSPSYPDDADETDYNERNKEKIKEEMKELSYVLYFLIYGKDL